VKKIALAASIVIVLSSMTSAPLVQAQAQAPATAPSPPPSNPDWLTPIAPFRIADNLYYVGSKDLASYLIVTPKGDILINSSFVESVPLIRASVEQLGFHFNDIKILLISHSHGDHDAGSADVVKQTGAKYMVMDGDVPVVESGGASDFAYGDQHYPAAKVDRVLHDGDEVRVDNVVLVAHKTPTHTRLYHLDPESEAGNADAERSDRRQLERESRFPIGG
jgi:glyoxylase-like metal-dependent hydrolase (beta-lactamase superfamily II)